MARGIHLSRIATLALAVAVAVPATSDAGNGALKKSIDQRFASPDIDEVPDFQRHVVPLFGRLGCNGRACHGSFQGQGGFRLSLFGYDFAADHEALLDKESPRVAPGDTTESLILNKPIDEDMHEGGKRYEKGSWQHHVLKRWVEEGADFDKQELSQLERIDVIPNEIIFDKAGQSKDLQVVAVWKDGTQEDVTPLCRFLTNNDVVAKIDDNGRVTAGQPGDTHVVIAYDKGVVPIPVLQPVSDKVGAAYPSVETTTEIDSLVVRKLRKLGIVPSDLATDAEFLRRVRLDLTGSLPTAGEVREFLADKSPSKRAAKIDELLETPAYVAWWTTKLCDFTGNNDQQLVNTTPVRNRASNDWYDWIYQRVEKNVPYDELAAGIVTATSRRPGQSYEEYCEEMSSLYQKDAEQSYADLPSMPLYWARRDFRELEARAIGFAYSFMGLRIQCAQCHKHPFDQWSKDDFAQFANFFGGVVASNRVRPDDRKSYDKLVDALGLKGKRGNDLRRESAKFLAEGKTIPFPEVYVQKPRRANARNRNQRNQPAQTARLLGGETIDLTQEEDPRGPLMEWLRSADNPYFARAFVNRVWATYFNVGIVEPPDDLSLANPPSNKGLLDYLTQGFIEQGFDMKWLHREIANSATYQRSWRANETNARDQVNFSHAIPRRLPAEVAFDAIQFATASDNQLVSWRDSNKDRAIAIPGANGQNRSRSPSAYALTVFGRSIRESNCDCDRSSEPSLLQTVYMQNDRDMFGMMNRRKTGWLDQLARELKITDNQLAAPQRPPNYDRQVASMKRQIERLKESGNKRQLAQLKQLQQRLAAFKKRFGDGPQDDVAASNAESDIDTAKLVEEAYLRTLNRLPTESETARSQQFIAESDNVLNGVRGVLWAPLNTKEFIVNH